MKVVVLKTELNEVKRITHQKKSKSEQVKEKESTVNANYLNPKPFEAKDITPEVNGVEDKLISKDLNCKECDYSCLRKGQMKSIL